MSISLLLSASSDTQSDAAQWTISNNQNTGTLPSPVSVPADSLLVVQFAGDGTAGASLAVTDSAGLTWTLASSSSNSSTVNYNYLFYAYAPSALANYSPTVHFDYGPTFLGFTLTAFSGVASSSPLGGASNATGDTASPSVALAGITAGSLVVGALQWGSRISSGYFAPDSGYTAAISIPPVVSGKQSPAYQEPVVTFYKLSSGTPENVGGNLQNSTTDTTPNVQQWSTIAAWFNAASGGTAITESASGTAAVAGSGTGSYGFKQAASGGIAATGQAGAAYGYDEGSAGVVQSSGASVGKYGLSESSAGIVQSSGAASAQYNFTVASGGAFSASGSTTAQYGFIESSSGTADATGTAQPSGGTNYVESASGTADVSGQAAGQYGFRVSAGGPIAFYGQSIGAYGYQEESSGAAPTSGAASGTYEFLQSAAGISQFTGSVPPARRADAIKLVSYSAMLNINMATLSRTAKDKMTVSAKPNVSLRVLP